MQNNVLRDALKHFKFNEKGASYMCEIMEKCIAEERAEDMKVIAGCVECAIRDGKTFEEAIAKLHIPDSYREDILKILQTGEK